MIPDTSFTYGDDLEFVRLCEQMKDDKGRTPSEESFRALGGAWNLPATELVILGPKGILLCVYGDGVEEFKGQWHIPGGYARLAHPTLQDDCNAVAMRELGVPVKWIRTIDAYKWLNGKEHPHGAPISIYMQCRALQPIKETETCKSFSISDLPKNMIEPQRRFVEKHASNLQIWKHEIWPIETSPKT